MRCQFCNVNIVQHLNVPNEFFSFHSKKECLKCVCIFDDGFLLKIRQV